ncbi:hypothetical protein Bca101_091941 [Brassica carinata]
MRNIWMATIRTCGDDERVGGGGAAAGEDGNELETDRRVFFILCISELYIFSLFHHFAWSQPHHHGQWPPLRLVSVVVVVSDGDGGDERWLWW